MIVKRLLLILILILPLMTFGAESFTQKLAATDLQDPDSVYQLAVWCKDNRYNSKSRKYFREVIKLEPNHEPARRALGYVFYKNKWQHESRVPKEFLGEQLTDGTEDAGGKPLDATGPGPQASEVAWDLTVPVDPTETESPSTGEWVRQIIGEMNRSGNYSNQMEKGYRTLMMEQYFASAIPNLCKALADGTYTDLFGPSMLLIEVKREGDDERIESARRLIPFMVKASEKITNGEDLEAMAMVIGTFAERRAMPRLIAMLGMDGDAANGAKMAISEITLMAERDITQEKAQKWWNTYHGASSARIYGDMLNSSHPETVVNAAMRLIPDGYRSAIPALIKVLKSDDNRSIWRADDALKQLTGSSWINLDMDDEERKRKIAFLEKWWKDNKATFMPPQLVARLNKVANQADKEGSRADTAVSMIAQLNNMNGTEAAAAEAGLRNLGNEAIEPLIKYGIINNDGIAATRARDILRQITGQNFGYEPLKGSQDARLEALEKWKTWATANAGVTMEGDEKEGEAPSEPENQPDPPKEGEPIRRSRKPIKLPTLP